MDEINSCQEPGCFRPRRGRQSACATHYNRRFKPPIEKPKAVESRLTAEETKTMWTFSRLYPIPYPVSMRLEFHETADLKNTEKAAINEARKHAKIIEERWYQTIRTLDARIDEIETEEINNGR